MMRRASEATAVGHRDEGRADPRHGRSRPVIEVLRDDLASGRAWIFEDDLRAMIEEQEADDKFLRQIEALCAGGEV